MKLEVSEKSTFSFWFMATFLVCTKFANQLKANPDPSRLCSMFEKRLNYQFVHRPEAGRTLKPPSRWLAAAAHWLVAKGYENWASLPVCLSPRTGSTRPESHHRVLFQSVNKTGLNQTKVERSHYFFPWSLPVTGNGWLWWPTSCGGARWMMPHRRKL